MLYKYFIKDKRSFVTSQFTFECHMYVCGTHYTFIHTYLCIFTILLFHPHPHAHHHPTNTTMEPYTFISITITAEYFDCITQ